MRNVGCCGRAIVGLGVVLLLLPACGKSGLGTSRDAANDVGNVANDTADAAPIPPTTDAPPTYFEDLAPGVPDLAKTPDLPPTDPAQAPDLANPRDVPGDPSFFADLADVFTRELGLPVYDTRPDLSSPPDIPGDLPPRFDVQINLDTPPYDLGGPDELPAKRDSYVSLDDRGSSDYCTASGGIVDTQLCCAGTSYFRDTCTAAVGACGCSPASSATVDVCTCPNGGCFLPGIGCVGPAGICTVGMDQTCNDDGRISSIHGRCIGGGRCLCTSFALSATSGKCL